MRSRLCGSLAVVMTMLALSAATPQSLQAQPTAGSPPMNLNSNEKWVPLVDDFQEASSPELTVLESTRDRTLVHVVLPGFWEASCPLDGSVYQKLTIPGGSSTSEVGRPQLPVIHALVAVPFDAKPAVTVRSSTEAVLCGYQVHPCQPPVFDAGVPRTMPVSDRSSGQDETWFPEQVVSLSPSGVWRDLNVVRIELSLVRYDQAAHCLNISNDAIIEIQHPSARGLLQNPDRVISPEFEAMYQGQVLNQPFLQSLTKGQRSRTGPHYLIITHPNFAAAIQPLADWHQRAGMSTEVISVTTTDPQVIKNTIISRYNQGSLEYVLLVGDPGYIPIATWDGMASDYWYSCITGSPLDLYADIALGRLSVTDSTQVDHQVAKTVNYSTAPALDTPWLTKTLLVAHMASGVYEYRACKEYIRTSIIPGTAFSTSTAYGDSPGVNNALVTSRINAGQGIVNYRGHGLTSIWWQWNLVPEDWTTANVNSLNNSGYTPVVFNIACENHRIQDTADSLGEAWMNKYPGGAVASLGATDDGVTYPNQDYDKQLYNEFCHQGEYRLGWMSNAAATYVLIHHPAYGPWNVKMFLWLGDPALELWTSMPGTLSVAHPETVPVGSSQVSVTVDAPGAPTDDALVCLWKDGEVYETQDATGGTATFTIAPATVGTLALTVTKHDYLPYRADVTVLEFLLADVNGDGLVNAFDIAPFVVALTMSEAEFVTQHPAWHYWAADCSQDGLVNGCDIEQFVMLLTGG